MVAVVVLASLNSRCHVYFGRGGLSTLRFSHGWPVHFQEGLVPGPGKRSSNPNELLPNHIWGYSESNDDPEIMARYMAELEGMPRTPWGLHTLAKLSVVGAVIDVAVAAGVLHLLSLVCEVSLYSTGRQRKNYYSIAGLLLVLALLAVIPSVAIADAWSYALVAFACVVVSIIVTGIMLSRGYD